MSGERLTDPTFAFFQQLRLAGEHHEQPHKQLIRPPIARPVLAGERKKGRRKERKKRSPRGLEKRKKLQREEGRGDTGHQGGGYYARDHQGDWPWKDDEGNDRDPAMDDDAASYAADYSDAPRVY